MVDFNNEATIGTPAVDIERVLILEKRNNFLLAWEHYRRHKHINVAVGRGDVVARLEVLFLELAACFKRRKGAGSYEEYLAIRSMAVDPKNDDEIMAVFDFINEELDKMNLIKIDTKRDIDKTRVEQENNEYDL